MYRFETMLLGLVLYLLACRLVSYPLGHARTSSTRRSWYPIAPLRFSPKLKLQNCFAAMETAGKVSTHALAEVN